jgi:NitT/TauT family transport system substrate-binding protein
MPLPLPVLPRRHWLATAAGLSLGLGGCRAPLPPLRLGAIPFAGYSFLFLAEELGLLDGHQVQLKELRSTTDVMRALATGRLEAAALTLDEVLTGLQGGLQLKVVAVLDQSAGADAVMARPGLHHPADARGRRVAVESSAVGALMLAAFLDVAGLAPSDVEQVRVALPDSAEAFRNGRADLVVTAEPWASQLEAEGACSTAARSRAASSTCWPCGTKCSSRAPRR